MQQRKMRKKTIVMTDNGIPQEARRTPSENRRRVGLTTLAYAECRGDYSTTFAAVHVLTSRCSTGTIIPFQRPGFKPSFMFLAHSFPKKIPFASDPTERGWG